MIIKNSPGAVDAAHGASETDELGGRVASENSLLAQLTQAVQHGGRCVHRAPNGAHEIATNAKRTLCELSSRRREAVADNHLKDLEALRLVNGGVER